MSRWTITMARCAMGLALMIAGGAVSPCGAQEQATAAPAAVEVSVTLGAPPVAMRANLLGTNMTGIDWFGTQPPDNRAPAFWDDKTHAPDASWDSLMRAYPMRMIRFHWGNGFAWKRNVGPVEKREPIPHELQNPKWKPVYRTNPGMDEFLRWAQGLPGKPEVTIVASPFRPVDELADLVAYCNATSGPMAELRAANGHPQPYAIKYWEMGNETDWRQGPQERALPPQEVVKQKEAKNQLYVEEYIKLIQPRIAAMRAVDPTIKIYPHAVSVPYGSYNPYWRQWQQRIMQELGDQIDGFAVHTYIDGWPPVPFAEQALDTLIADMQTYGPKDHPLDLWISEYGRWYQFWKLPHSTAWNLQAAISNADYLMALMPRPQVTSANIWCLISTGPWRTMDVDRKNPEQPKCGTPLYYMFDLMNRAMLPQVQRLTINENDGLKRPDGYSYTLRAVLFSDPATGKRALVAINRSNDQSAMMNFYAHLPEGVHAQQLLLTGPSLEATNEPGKPLNVTMQQSQVDIPVTKDGDGGGRFLLPPRSVAAWLWTQTPDSQGVSRAGD